VGTPGARHLKYCPLGVPWAVPADPPANAFELCAL
jgi:hypothetical protein